MTSPASTEAYDPTIADWATRYDIKENPLLHQIDMSVTGGAFASVRNPAWHNLGVTVDHQVSADELLKLAHADYDVFLAPSMTELEVPMLGADGQPLTISGEPLMTTIKATDESRRQSCRYHPETGALQILGNVSPSYGVHTNREVFVDFADALIDAAEPIVSTCGVMYEGREAFMAFQLPQGIMVGGVDATALYMVAHTSHDGSKPATVMIVPLRVVCANTLRVAGLAAISRWSIRHTSKSKLKLQEAREGLKLSWKYLGEWTTMADALLEQEMTTREFEKIVTSLFEPRPEADKPVGAQAKKLWDEKLDAMLTLWSGPTQENIKGTAWAAFNAVDEHLDWGLKVQSSKWAGDPAGYQFWRSLDGEKSVQAPKQKMLETVARFSGVKLAKASA
jgi:phage/plasmid-like protein (TIGR03299 family)